MHLDNTYSSMRSGLLEDSFPKPHYSPTNITVEDKMWLQIIITFRFDVLVRRAHQTGSMLFFLHRTIDMS